jgi:hypothetical protein
MIKLIPLILSKGLLCELRASVVRHVFAMLASGFEGCPQDLQFKMDEREKS